MRAGCGGGGARACVGVGEIRPQTPILALHVNPIITLTLSFCLFPTNPEVNSRHLQYSPCCGLGKRVSKKEKPGHWKLRWYGSRMLVNRIHGLRDGIGYKDTRCPKL